MPNGLTVHQGLCWSRQCSRTSAIERYDAAPRSIGEVPPPAAAAQLAPRNSSLVATRSCARLRARSGSSTSTWVSSGSRSTSSSISSTRTGASDSMPSTAMPAAILSVSSSSWGWAAPSSAARRRTSSVSSSSRHGGAQSRSAFSSVRWSATEKERISSTSSPQNSTRSGCSSVGGKTSTMPPRTANSPRRSTRSTREYAAAERRRTTSSSSAVPPGDELDRLEVAEPLDLRLQQRAHRRDHDLQRAVGRVVARVAEPAEHREPAADGVAARAEPLVGQRLPARVVADQRRVDEVAERLDEVLGLAGGGGHGEDGAPLADQPGDDERTHRLGTGEVEGADGAAPRVLHRRGERGVGEDGVGEAGEVHERNSCGRRMTTRQPPARFGRG